MTESVDRSGQPNVKADAVAVRLTAPGRSAVATIAVWGHDAAEIVNRFFQSPREADVAEAKADAILFGRWGGDRGEELVVCRTESGVEIHCHGGVAAYSAVLNDLSSAGVRVEEEAKRWRAHVHQKRIERDATTLLEQAATLLTADHLLAQANGALREELTAIDADYREGRAELARLRTQSLLARSPVGRHLVSPWRVVLAGPPNVGKSSLINRIVGFDRAVVFDRPGTTRDVVTASGAVGGWPILWSDTAGIREVDHDPLEAEGVDRASRAIGDADLVLNIRDASTMDRGPLAGLNESTPTIQVANKIDLIPEVRLDGEIGVSAATGDGVAKLTAAVLQRLIGEPPEVGAALPFMDWQCQQLNDSLSAEDAASASRCIRSMLA